MVGERGSPVIAAVSGGEGSAYVEEIIDIVELMEDGKLQYEDSQFAIHNRR